MMATLFMGQTSEVTIIFFPAGPAVEAELYLSALPQKKTAEALSIDDRMNPCKNIHSI